MSCGAANEVAVFRTTAAGLEPLGAIPTGWYPTAVAVDAKHGVLYVADGKGESGHANPRYAATPAPGKADNPAPSSYIAEPSSDRSAASPIPDDAALARGLPTCASSRSTRRVPRSAIVRAGGPIRHVFYVIKENRSYDQVLGDVAGADGRSGRSSVRSHGDAEPARARAPLRHLRPLLRERARQRRRAQLVDRRVRQRLPREDVAAELLRTGARCTTSRTPRTASTPHDGYLWDDAVAHGITFRNYGEFATGRAQRTDAGLRLRRCAAPADGPQLRDLRQ